LLFFPKNTEGAKGMKCPKCHFENPADTSFCGNCGTEFYPSEKASVPQTETIQAAKKELKTGSTFARRYQIIEDLGKGGMGEVYKVFDKEIKEKVALKLLNPEIAADNKTIERFRNELKFARKIGHRNVCRMYDLGKEEGSYYITMEYVPGEDLKSTIIRVGQLSVGKAIFIARQICEGLAEAHRLGVMHRDLKPQNIMLDKDGNARIMDFGIARSLTTKGITDSGVIIGTPEYMSPEQVEGKETDHRTDIYTLGVILYEMVTGRVPFKGDTPLSIAVKHKTETPKNPKEANSQIPEDLSRLILICMEKDKEKRYQNIEEILSELKTIEKEIPTKERILPKKKIRKEKISRIKWKNFALYGGAAAIILILFIVGRFFLFTGRQETINSIAVLPLKNLSGDPEQEYFAEGMTDALISNLAKIEALTVISRQSVMRYKRTEKSLPQIARELNVGAVVEGTVLRSGQRVRITAQLIEARTDRHLWAESYERGLRDILLLQSEVARAIAHEIQVKLKPQEEALLASTDQIEPEAYEFYLKGRFHWNKRSAEELKKGLEYFQKAIEKDPNWALAYAGLADSYSILGEYSVLPPKETYPKAKAAALKALEIDDGIAEAHTALALAKRDYDWDWLGAEKEYKRAIELNPSYPIAHQWYAEYLSSMGRHDEALEEIRRAQELDPLSLIINAVRGMILYYARQYDQSIEQCRKTIDLDSTFIPARYFLGWNYAQKGMYEEAIAEMQEAVKLSRGNPRYIAELGATYAMAGKKGDAFKILEELKKLSKQRYISPFYTAIIYTALRDDHQALEWLEKAFAERSYPMVWLKMRPTFDSLRSNPKFTALLQKMDLEK